MRYYQIIDEKTKEEYSRFLFNRPFSLLFQREKELLYKYQIDMKNPHWKYIYLHGKLTKYSISNTGEVRNNENGLILAKKIQKGYYFINLTIETNSGLHKRMTFSIHRLVANAFIPNPDNKPEVNHMNGNKKCNWVGNLEWVTNKENVDHAIRTGLSKVSGIHNARNKFPEETIHRVCQLLEQGKSPIEISKIVDITINVIYSIKRGITWNEISKGYNIPKPMNVEKFKEIRGYIIDLIMAGYSNEEIVNMVELCHDTQTKKIRYVNLVRRRYLKYSNGK